MKKVLCIGVWDLIHEGHIKFLDKAKELGEVVVGIVKDGAVKAKKGENRPLMKFRHRQLILEKMGYKTEEIDDFYFPEILITNFDWVIVGEDQAHFKNVNNIPYEKKIIFPRYEGISTTKILGEK